jgi:hypothetical protein
MDERMENFITGNTYSLLDVIGEGAYGIVWSVSNACNTKHHLNLLAAQQYTCQLNVKLQSSASRPLSTPCSV